MHRLLKNPAKKLCAKTIIERKTSKGKAIHYTPLMKAVIKENPQLIKTFLQARKALIQHPEKKQIRQGSFEIELLKRPGRILSRIYKLKYKEKTVFIKEQDPQKRNALNCNQYSLASHQILTLQKAKKALEEIKEVEVAQYHLAWTNQNHSYLITDYYEGNLIIDKLPPISPEKLDKIFSQIKNALANYQIADAGVHNAIYCPKTGKIILFDLTQPYQEF